MLKQVRAWARMGYNASKIQAELDYKFGKYLAGIWEATAPAGAVSPKDVI